MEQRAVRSKCTTRQPDCTKLARFSIKQAMGRTHSWCICRNLQKHRKLPLCYQVTICNFTGMCVNRVPFQ